MKIFDEGIILSAEKYQENLLLIRLLSRENGICSGIYRSSSKKAKNSSISANLVKFQRFSRLENQLGTISFENIRSFEGQIIFNKNNLYAFKILSNLIISSFAEIIPYSSLFDSLKLYLENLSMSEFSYLNYLDLEMKILKEAGYGINLNPCAVCEKDDCVTVFVSPKSARGVGYHCAGEYRSALLKIPTFIKNKTEPSNIEELKEGFDLTEYFFVRYLLKDKKISEIIDVRNKLRNMIF